MAGQDCILPLQVFCLHPYCCFHLLAKVPVRQENKTTL